jgi:hypothetical protein
VWQQFHCGQNASCLPLLRRSHGRRPPTQGVPRCAEGAQTSFFPKTREEAKIELKKKKTTENNKNNENKYGY